MVVVGRSFEDQPEFIQQHIIARVYCGCQYAADDPEAAVRQLRKREEQEKLDFLMEYGRAMADAKKSSDPNVPIIVIVLMLALVLLWLITRS